MTSYRRSWQGRNERGVLGTLADLLIGTEDAA
jgi:hypothetical protein